MRFNWMFFQILRPIVHLSSFPCPVIIIVITMMVDYIVVITYLYHPTLC